MDIDILTDIVNEMSPRISSAILAQMEPAAAWRLTLELVSRSAPPSPEAGQQSAQNRGQGPS